MSSCPMIESRYTPTNESRDLLVRLDLLVKRLDIFCQALELLGRLLQRGQVGRSSVRSCQRVELERGLK